MEEQGKKFDSEKPRMALLPHESLEEIAKVLTFGSKKYGKNNWKGGLSYERLISASMRHIGQFNNGEDKDPETGISHVAHAACNLLFLIWMEKNRQDLDDRSSHGKTKSSS